MKPFCCHVCQSKSPPKRGQVIASLPSYGPWAAKYTLFDGWCSGCRADVTFLDVTFDSTRAECWNACTEIMRPGDGYEVVYRRRYAKSRDVAIQVHAWWAWCPIDDADWRDRAANAITESEAWQSEMSPFRVLILPAAADLAFWPGRLGDGCDEVWRLDADRMGIESGPYGRVRAEISLSQTLQQIGSHSLWHVWPAASLWEPCYLEMGPPEEISAAWSSYARRNLCISLHTDQINDAE